MTAPAADAPAYPPVRRTGPVELLHGTAVSDPYRWMEDEADPATAAWSTAQDALFAAHRNTWAALGPLRRHLAALMAGGSVTAPVPRGGRLFDTVRAPGRDQPVLRVVEDGGARTLWDPLAHDPAGLTVLESWEPSWDGSLVAVQYAAGGTERCELVVLDVANGRMVDGPVDRLRRSPVAWLPDSAGFYYVRNLPPSDTPGEEGYHRRVRLHRIGVDPERDELVFGAGRAMDDYYAPALSPDGRWLTVTATRGASPATELWLADLSEAAPESPRLRRVGGPVGARATLLLPSGTASDGPAYLLTRRDAPNGRVEVTSPARLTGRGARTPDEPPDAGPRPTVLIPEDPVAVLTDFAVLDGPGLARSVALATRVRHAVGEVTVHDLATGRRLSTLELPGPGTVGELHAAPDGHEAYFGYTDHATPVRVLRFDARSGTLTPLHGGGATGPADGGEALGGRLPDADEDRTAAPGAAACVTRRVRYRSHDGTPVTLFVLSPIGRPDRPRPTVLSGYGGFGASIVPGFAPQALAWVAAGGVYAFACLRGGGEEGQRWHDAGRRAGKQNTFDDLDAAADWLVAAGWADPARLGLLGSSNGGLTVAAAMTQHPEKYAAVVAVAPLLDMVRYERSGMGPSWREEYGSAEDAEDFAVLHAYSPYHRVRTGVRYPAVLLGAADGDTRVSPSHARKMCAALQHASTGSGPVLLRLEHGVGHGIRGTATTTELFADVMAFLAEHLRLTALGS
ncbi:prolyl oligopeptidase family protein [Streptomyces sp. NPDC127039]|uniref:prolyl oligopeptidase family serine peptidase n=1 Tax=Streptomyces sp. NPDC127039 TaxID=3347115 RepID=UPI00365C475B